MREERRKRREKREERRMSEVELERYLAVEVDIGILGIDSNVSVSRSIKCRHIQRNKHPCCNLIREMFGASSPWPHLGPW